MKLELNDVSLEETSKLIDKIIPLLATNKLIIFDGMMGSGKTTLIKYICQALGVLDLVNSPTYSLVNEYKTLNNQIIYESILINSIENLCNLFPYLCIYIYIYFFFLYMYFF